LSELQAPAAKASDATQSKIDGKWKKRERDSDRVSVFMITSPKRDRPRTTGPFSC
jgi:hypothetical protein